MSTETLPVVHAPPATRGPLAVNNMNDLRALAELLAASNFFADARGAAQAAVKILAGRELGFQTIASMTGVHIIEGKPSIGAHLMASLIKRSGKYDYKILRLDRTACRLRFFERVEGKWETLPGDIEMTLQEAVDAGLAIAKDGKSLKKNWATSADDMLFARCISKGYRRHCPDLTGGVTVYVDGEIEPAEASTISQISFQPGDIVDTGYTPPDGTQVGMEETTPPPAPPAPEPAPVPVPNSPAPAPPSAPGLITAEERETIIALWREHRRTTEDMQRILGSLGISVLAQVPAERADWVRTAIIQGLAPTALVDQIAKAVESRKIPWEGLQARLKERYGVTSLAHLTLPQAQEVLSKLAPPA